MNAVLYYSNTGESKRIAEYIAHQTGYALVDLTETEHFRYECAAIIFPVHCQNVPQAVSSFLSRLQTKYLALIATYGKMSYGNVLYEIQRKYRHNVIAAAYVPTKHAYINEPRFADFDKLTPIVKKIGSTNPPTAVKIPHSRKNPFADFLPKLRSQIGCKIVKDEKKCNNCEACNAICPQNAIVSGATNARCVRCLRCVVNCPNKALTTELSRSMRAYLNKSKTEKLILYV